MREWGGGWGRVGWEGGGGVSVWVRVLSLGLHLSVCLSS